MDKDRVAKVKVVSPTPTVVLLIILHEHGRLKKNIVEPTVQAVAENEAEYSVSFDEFRHRLIRLYLEKSPNCPNLEPDHEHTKIC